MKKKLTLFFQVVFLLCGVTAIPMKKGFSLHIKPDTIPQSSIPDTLNPDKKQSLVFLGITYGNNSSFLGRYQTKVLPYYSADVSYMNKTGFYLACIAYKIGTSSEMDILSGWNFDLSKRLDGSVFYTRYFFSGDSELLKASVANTATASLGLDWTFLYTKLSSSYAFGRVNDVFMVFDNSHYFEFPRILHQDDYLSIDPKVSIIAGTQTFVESYFINEGIPLRSTPVTPGPGRGNQTNGGGTTTTEYVKNTFSILSYEFTLPVTYNFRKFSFDLSGRYSVPVNLLDGDVIKPQFFFTGSVIFTIKGKK